MASSRPSVKICFRPSPSSEVLQARETKVAAVGDRWRDMIDKRPILPAMVSKSLRQTDFEAKGYQDHQYAI